MAPDAGRFLTASRLDGGKGDGNELRRVALANGANPSLLVLPIASRIIPSHTVTQGGF